MRCVLLAKKWPRFGSNFKKMAKKISNGKSDGERKIYILAQTLICLWKCRKERMKMNLKNMKNPQLKGRDSKVVRLIRNSCPFITNFGHVWSDQTRVTHLQNVLCVIRTSVVLILDDMIVKDILKVNNTKTS